MKSNAIPLQYKITVGLLILVAAALGISMLTELFSFNTVAQYWPILIIVAGFVMINSGAKSPAGGISAMVIGGLLLALKQGWLANGDSRLFETLTIVLVALLLIVSLAPAGTPEKSDSK